MKRRTFVALLAAAPAVAAIKSERYEVREVTWAGGACPWQMEGYTTCNRPFYARFRHGYLDLSVGPVGVGQKEWDLLPYVYSEQISENSWDSTYADIRAAVSRIINLPPEISKDARYWIG